MSLERAPPTRYRVEEKNGRLIVHDTQQGGIVGDKFAIRPADRTGAALNSAKRRSGSALNLVARASAGLDAMEKSVSSPEASHAKGPPDQESTKRGAIVAVVGIVLALVAVVSGLWIGVVIAMIVAPVRQAILNRFVPAVKLYIAEGRWR